MTREEISREEAVERVRECEYGILITADVEAVPILGELPEDEKPKLKKDVSQYEFGDDSYKDSSL